MVLLPAINICMSRLPIKLFQSIKIRPPIISLPRMWYELFMMSRVHKNNFHDVLSHCQITVVGPFDLQHQPVTLSVTHCCQSCPEYTGFIIMGILSISDKSLSLSWKINILHFVNCFVCLNHIKSLFSNIYKTIITRYTFCKRNAIKNTSYFVTLSKMSLFLTGLGVKRKPPCQFWKVSLLALEGYMSRPTWTISLNMTILI